MQGYDYPALYLISEGDTLSYLKADEKYGLSTYINRKLFRVADTSLSYRQISYLDKDGLLGQDSREHGKGWRLFSLKEVIYLLLVVELKKYGYSQEKLQPICHSLLLADKNAQGLGPNKHAFDEVIGLCLMGAEINIVANPDQPLTFFDPPNYAIFGHSGRSRVLITLNNIVNEGLKMLDKKPIDAHFSVAARYLDGILSDHSSKLTDKEQKVVEALRNQNYVSVEVRKKDGALDVMKVKALEKYLANQADVINVIKSKDYADIRLVKRDGKVVHLASKDTVKL